MSAGQRSDEREIQSIEPVSAADIRYPLMLPANRWKRAAKVGLGRTVLTFRPRYSQRLLREGDPMTFSTVDRLIVAGLVSRATNDEDWSALSGIQQRFWAGQGGAIFNAAPEVEERFHNWFLTGHTKPLDRLQRELAESAQPCAAVCEIGSGNGLALEYLSQQLTAVSRFIGIDINADATERNNARWQADPKLEFVNADAVQWIEEHSSGGWAFFSNAGVLEYFPQDKVERLYRHTASLDGPAWWVLTEPIYDGYDLATETNSRVNGSEFSFCHNHPHLLKQAGWEVIEQSVSETDGMSWLMLCARRADGGRL